MSEMTNIEIVEYGEKMAKDLAEMYNSWDELWPGGYTQGVPYDEDRVKDQYSVMSAIAILIAIDKESDKPVGSCTLHPHWRDEDAAYIGVLGVSPEALNKKVGKKLLLKAIELSRDDGKTRVDLNTWPGNMRAVPLYKKVGLMWNPSGDGVQMEDYVPGILDHPLIENFFKSLPEGTIWYDVHERDIVQAPDDFTEDNMEIFPYRFAHNDNSISVTVDKHSRYITAVERNIDDSMLSISARVSSHTVLCEVPSTYTVEIENGSKSTIELKAKVSSFKTLKLSGETSRKISIEPGKKEVWELEFTVSSETPVHRRNLRTPTIDLEIDFEGKKSHFRTGLVIKPAAEIRQKGPEVRIFPGGKATIPLSVLNEAEFEMKGTIHIESPSDEIRISPTEGNVSLKSKGISGLMLDVDADSSLDSGTYDLWAYLDLSNADGISIRTRKFRIPIFCLENGSIAIGEDDRLLRTVIVSSDYTATIDKEGAILRAKSSEFNSGGTFLVRSQVGPPFGIDAFRFAPREIELSHEDGDEIVTMTGIHPERPLEIEDRAIFENGTGVVIHQVWIKNTSKEPHTLQVRVYGGGGGISLSSGKKYLSLQSGVVGEDVNNVTYSYPSLPSSPETFKEGWIALVGKHSTKGEFWNNDSIEEVVMNPNQIGKLQYPTTTLQPGERRLMSELWLVFGQCGWHSVQRTWQMRIKKKFPIMIEHSALKEYRVFDFDVTPAITNSLSECEAKLITRKPIVAPLPVNLEVEGLDGWSAEIKASNAESDRDDKNKLENHPLDDAEEFLVKLIPQRDSSDGFKVLKGHIKIRSITDRRYEYHLIQLGASGSDVVVSDIEEEGCKGFLVKNGLIEFKVSNDYGGCLYSLKNSQGTELLISSFPTGEAKPGGFLQNYFGGIQPVVWDGTMDEDFTNVNTNREEMTGNKVEIGQWAGVEIQWVGNQQQSARGVDLRVQYLTTSGSPLVLTRWIIRNTTDSPLNLVPSFTVDPGFNGEVPPILFRGELNDEVTDFYQSQAPSVSLPESNFIWVHNGDSVNVGEGLALIHEGMKPAVFGFGVAGMIILGTNPSNKPILPQEERIAISCFVADPNSVEELKGLQKNLEYLLEE